MFNSAVADQDLLPRRAARIAFGLVLMAGFATLVLELATVAGGVERNDRLWSLLPATWLLAACAALVVRTVVTRRAGCGDRLLLASVVVPGIGIALLLPLTLHLPFILAADGGEDFTEWAAFGLIFTGHVHILLAILVAIRARALVERRAAPGSWSIYRTCTLVSLLPGIVWGGAPTLLVALTGLPFLPLLGAMARVIDAERAVAAPPIPRAAVRA